MRCCDKCLWIWVCDGGWSPHSLVNQSSKVENSVAIGRAGLGGVWCVGFLEKLSIIHGVDGVTMRSAVSDDGGQASGTALMLLLT